MKKKLRIFTTELHGVTRSFKTLLVLPSVKLRVLRGFILIPAVFLLAGCADPEGLHNQKQSLVTFEFINFPLADGEFVVSGNWQGSKWDNTKSNITLKNGAGVSSEQSVKSSYVKFTITPVGVWGRSWYPATMGNAPDETQGNVRWNFEVNGLPMDVEATITIDGGKKPVDITWK